MSSYKGHLFMALFFFVSFLALAVWLSVKLGEPALVDPFHRWWQAGILLIIAILSALWPDVDTSSTGRKIFYPLFFLLDLYLIVSENYKEAAILGLLAMLPSLGKHRGWTHTLWAAILIPSPILLVPMYFAKGYTLSGLPYFLAAVTGYLSHLFADGKLFR